MKTTSALIGACAVLALGATGVAAGPCTTEITNLEKTAAMKDAGSGPTSGSVATSSGAARPQHEATGSVNKAVGDRAASPADVRRQTQGEPTAAGQAQGKETSGGAMSPDATASLSKARMLDNQGKEAECMEAVKAARTQMGQ